jgi:hypothetical protein
MINRVTLYNNSFILNTLFIIYVNLCKFFSIKLCFSIFLSIFARWGCAFLTLSRMGPGSRKARVWRERTGALFFVE